MKKILISFFFIINPLLMYCQDTVYSTFDRDDGIYYNPILDQTTWEPYDGIGATQPPVGFGRINCPSGLHLFNKYHLNDTVRLMVYGVAIMGGASGGDSLIADCVMLKPGVETGQFYISDTADHYREKRYFTTVGRVRHRAVSTDYPPVEGHPFECIDDSIREKTALAVEYYFPSPIEIRPWETFAVGCVVNEGHYILMNFACEESINDHDELISDSIVNTIAFNLSSGYISYEIPYTRVCLIYPIITPPALDTVPQWPQASQPEVRYLDTVYAQLSWEPAEGSTAYQLMVTMPDGSEMVRNCLSTTYYLYDLEQGGHYTAKVRAQMHHRCYYHDTVFFGEWSDTVGFTVPANEPVGIDPTGNSVGEVLLRPNPVHSLLTVEHPSMEQAVIEVLNTSGLCVMKVSVRECETVLDVSTLPKGSYLLRLYSGESMVFRTFVVE